MRTVKFFIAVFIVFFSLLIDDISDAQPSNPPHPHILNIVVILDTSDRLQHDGQVERDIRIIEQILTEFIEVTTVQINQSEHLGYFERLAVVIPDQSKMPALPPEMTEKLEIKDSGDHRNLKNVFDDLKNQKQALLAELPKICAHVLQHKQTGSDIYAWFRDEASDYLRKDRRNVIICISDGYLIFDKDIQDERAPNTYMKVKELRDDPEWKQKIQKSHGLAKIDLDFRVHDVTFLMVEIALRTNDSGVPYQRDFQIIKCYWQTWLNAMGITKVNFLKQGRPVARKIQTCITGN